MTNYKMANSNDHTKKYPDETKEPRIMNIFKPYIDEIAESLSLDERFIKNSIIRNKKTIEKFLNAGGNKNISKEEKTILIKYLLIYYSEPETDEEREVWKSVLEKYTIKIIEKNSSLMIPMG